ncbi:MULTISPECIES: cytochrome c biogenesis protein [unclassified Lentimonas]|uniref:cytochrome c biogenesis protein n=1 Tax=unclassified Lentimonas TaxID=2630993 RepID=UPI00132455C7|nr:MULTISPECIES: cytochrome c biogenesis protein CcsA [unclassified Lentimonas]CAA6679454.1 Putative cytochrome C-type biogenesis protein [Lentimonas sp. CC4]CAA6687125.1 Putative cytochrome C-type biogenesis protein [Lentimonas sp. CC6]CAA7075528.1 Putative cytochrome C-type biogenesis protein [Lentimonas sp. CC4]CAA7170295.1 Putative cytochrome C-type biogenesis protein [Lentimonas sp. CC21]CAA7182589.1 Putative cytochrome C-type biogenesis protein [Lentimonas sp. CC8]
MKKLAFSLILIIAALIVARGFNPSTNPTDFDVDSFAELPVQVGGRIKPLDSVARNTLLVLAARQKVVTPEGVTLSPIEWFMDLTMRPELADTYRVFKIEFPDDLGISGLAEQGQRYYAFNDLLPHFDEILRLYGKINPDPKLRSPYEQQIADLNDGLTRYHRVMHSLHPVGTPERLDRLVDEYQTYAASVTPGLAALRQQQAGEDYDAELLGRFIQFGDDYLKLSKTAYLRVVPPPAPVDPLDDWKNIGLELLDVMRGDGLSPYVTSYASLTMAYRQNQPEMFNQTVQELRQRFIADFPNDIARVHYEREFNQLQPFYISMQLYVLIFLTVCISWLRWPETFTKAAFWVLLLAFAIHTFGLVSRMYIQGRPPVTNLYSSAVFVGWGAVLLGAFLEKFFKNGVGAAMASLVGFCTLIIAHHLSMSGDTLEMMRAVLDSNFWLATHVVVITFGYSAMFFAGALALIFTCLGLFSKNFDKQSAKSIVSMVYGITCFACLFSLVGTILGGIWADQSWGRFWGWDPKENGALMIVVMGAIVLHARWGGIVKERGLMALAICGNVVTVWSWFGTNLLGVGLHAYGFTSSGFWWTIGFAASQIFFIILVTLPWRYWRSAYGKEKHHLERKRILIAVQEADAEQAEEATS